MAASATEAVLTFGLVSVIPGTTHGAQGIGIIGAIGVDGSEAAQGAITPIIKDAEKQ